MASPDELPQLLFPRPFSYRFMELIPQHRVSGFLFWPESPHRIQHHVKKSTIDLNPSPFQKAVIDLILWHFPWQADSHPIRSPPSLVLWVSGRSLQNCHQLPLSNQAPQGGNKWWTFPTGEVAAWLFFFGGGAGFGILLAVFGGNYWKLEIFLVLKKCKLHIFSGAEVTDVLNRTCWKSAIWDILISFQHGIPLK